MKESLFDYLLAYRVERSLELLRHTDLEVTGIAETADLPIPAIMPGFFVERWDVPPSSTEKTGGKVDKLVISSYNIF